VITAPANGREVCEAPEITSWNRSTVQLYGELRTKGDSMSTSDDHDVATKAGETAGMFAGVLTGARIGAFAIPIPIVGTFVGGVVGGVVGTELGKRFGTAVFDGASAFMRTITTATTSGK
jgi:phage tail tape-measure protein